MFYCLLVPFYVFILFYFFVNDDLMFCNLLFVLRFPIIFLFFEYNDFIQFCHTRLTSMIRVNGYFLLENNFILFYSIFFIIRDVMDGQIISGGLLLIQIDSTSSVWGWYLCSTISENYLNILSFFRKILIILDLALLMASIFY